MIQGKKIATAYTLNTMYADNKIELRDKKGEIYRIDVSELLKMIQRENFEVKKLRKYNHLTLVPREKIPVDELIDALNHLDELADIGSDYEEKSDQEKSYNFLFQHIKCLK